MLTTDALIFKTFNALPPLGNLSYHAKSTNSYKINVLKVMDLFLFFSMHWPT